MINELRLQKDYLDEPIETIYFGGGTPSLLSTKEIESFLITIDEVFQVIKGVEITLEANPDDLNIDQLEGYRSVGINRLSIGIQSFNNHFLEGFNRAHDSLMALSSVRLAKEAGFANISVDLIFGLPDQSLGQLNEDLDQFLKLDIDHISIYGLTIEDKTVFGKWYQSGKLMPIDEELAAEQFELIMHKLIGAGFEQYEISNFARPGYRSKHNSSYWQGKKYLGIGPSAHSFNQKTRQFNIANNAGYIKALKSDTLAYESEVLSREDHINESILTQLRTREGVNLTRLKERWSFDLRDSKKIIVDQLIESKMVVEENGYLSLSSKGKLLADHITSKLMI